MPNRESMTSRQRVLAVLNGQTPDRFPIDLGVHYSTGISAFAYRRLRETLGLPCPDPIDICDPIQFLARVEEDVLRRFRCDCMLLLPPWARTAVWNPRGDFRFSIPATMEPVREGEYWVVRRAGATLRMPEGGYFFDGGWPSFEEGTRDEILDRYAREAERIFKETDYATMYIGFGAFFGGLNPDWLCSVMLEPERIRESLEQQLAGQIEACAAVIERMGPYIQMIALNSDLGTQNGPILGPEVYRDVCAPYLKRFCDFIHANSDCKTFLHSCGSIRAYIPTLIECGIDVLNPVQVTASGMDPDELKAEFGDRVVFWGGGCNTQHVLGVRGPEDVARNVRDLCNRFKPGGGFVFNQVHNVMGDVPPENIVAMLDTAYDCSFYTG